MSKVDLTYLCVPPLSAVRIPEHLNAFRCLVLIEREIDDDLRQAVSEQLVASGCLYMMAWGIDCSLWDESVDQASLKAFDCADIPDDHFIMTTWHEKDTLQDAVFFAKYCATHSYAGDLISQMLILDFHDVDRSKKIAELFDKS